MGKVQGGYPIRECLIRKDICVLKDKTAVVFDQLQIVNQALYVAQAGMTAEDMANALIGDLQTTSGDPNLPPPVRRVEIWRREDLLQRNGVWRMKDSLSCLAISWGLAVNAVSPRFPLNTSSLTSTSALSDLSISS